MHSIHGRAPAKINLTLRVGPRRADGYHEIESLVAKVGIYDEITIHRREDRRLTLECDDLSIPTDETNLALRAARKLADAAGDVECGVHIVLKKCIPAGAGLGGGSSDAATVLKLLNELWRLGISRDDLASLGAALGSDVPLFLYGPLCVIRGRGELVEEISRPLPQWVVLITPPVHCATREIYAAFDRLSPPPQRPTMDHILCAKRIEDVVFNDLMTAALAACPDLRETYERFHRTYDWPVHLTGSGSALFRFFEPHEEETWFADAAMREPSEDAVAVSILASETPR